MSITLFARKLGWFLGILVFLQVLGLFSDIIKLGQATPLLTQSIKNDLPFWYVNYLYPFASDVKRISFLMDIIILWEIWRLKKIGIYLFFAWNTFIFLTLLFLPILTSVHDASFQLDIISFSLSYIVIFGVWFWAFKRKWKLFS